MTTAFDLLAGLVVDDDGRRWGEAAEPYQRQRMAAILDESPSAVALHLVSEPKGSRKTTDNAGGALARMLTSAPTGARLYGVALDQQQAKYLLESMREFRDRTEGLGGIVVTETRCAYPPRNVIFEVLTADAGGAQGARPFHLVIDELAEWPDMNTQKRLLANLLGGFEKTYRIDQRARAVLCMNAGSPVSLAGRQYKQALESRFWRVHELFTPDGMSSPLPWVSADDLERARELAETDAAFARLHLGLWDEGPDRLATVADIEACCVLNGEQAPRFGKSYIVTADLGLRRDLSVLAVLHRDGPAAGGATFDGDGASGGGPGRLVVDVLRVWKAPRGGEIDLLEVGAQAEDLSRDYGNAPVFLDSWQAAPLVQMLQQRGVRAELQHATESKNSRAVVSLMAMLGDRRIDLPNDPDLIAELSTLPVIETRPNTWKVGDDRAGGSHHDRYSAIALGAVLLDDFAMESAAARLSRRPAVVMQEGAYLQWERLASLHRPMAQCGDPRALRWLRDHPEPDVVIGRRRMPANRRR